MDLDFLISVLKNSSWLPGPLGSINKVSNELRDIGTMAQASENHSKTGRQLIKKISVLVGSLMVGRWIARLVAPCCVKCCLGTVDRVSTQTVDSAAVLVTKTVKCIMRQ